MLVDSETPLLTVPNACESLLSCSGAIHIFMSAYTHTYTSLINMETHKKLHAQLCLAISVSELRYVSTKRVVYLV